MKMKRPYSILLYIGVMSVPSISVKMEDILVHLTGKYMKMVEMHFIRTIGFGIHDTIPIIVGRCIGFGYSSHCCITDLHNISDPF